MVKKSSLVEAEFVQPVADKNIVLLKDWFFEKEQIMVMELCEYGDLKKHISQ